MEKPSPNRRTLSRLDLTVNSSATARDPNSLTSLGPSQGSRYVRGELLVPLVLLFQRLVLGDEKSAKLERSAAAQMAHHRAGAPPAGRTVASASLRVSQPSDGRSPARIRRYPFVKETLSFPLLEPAVHYVISKVRFLGSENVIGWLCSNDAF